MDSQPHLIHKKNVEYEHYTSGLIHCSAVGVGRLSHEPLPTKNGFPKTFEANAKILGRCPCCVRLSPVALRIIEKDWRTETAARLSIFFPDALVCWRSWYNVGPLPVDKWTYNFCKLAEIYGTCI